MCRSAPFSPPWKRFSAPLGNVIRSEVIPTAENGRLGRYPRAVIQALKNCRLIRKRPCAWRSEASFYRLKADEDFMEEQSFVSKLRRKKPYLKLMPRHIQRSHAGKSVIRSRVEHVFIEQKSQTELFVRTVGITRVTMKIGLANIVYSMHRSLFWERISASA